MTQATSLTAIDPDGNRWTRTDGSVVDCREKLRQLRENQADLSQCLQDYFEDAILMDVDAEALRRLLHGMVDKLRDPRPSRS
ncbi:hypothetical protein ACELLULO517_09665 [Acidisoma cellulosilytica]|uniref:Uncharacterized protein n=1 Tax=Acidisoma cellulosilyticum TaxID=2802395 RepID=A0A964E3K1_9PROT|nr:hypothetical protein [Acidisoma cellulosilyticum]MCB8880499.1 hypothetical protein [Acidisoma cellulosilyticum]